MGDITVSVKEQDGKTVVTSEENNISKEVTFTPGERETSA